MNATARSRLLPRLAGRRPAIIAHTGGNSISQAEAAIAAGADAVEIDLYVHRGSFEARHARSLYPAPVWLEGFRPRVAPSRRFGLAELLELVQGRTEILLDLKGHADSAGKLVREALDASAGTEVSSSSQNWPALRSLATRCPEVDVYYSVDVRSQLDLFLSVIDRDRLPDGLSCRHTLITPQLVRRLKDRDLTVIAWTVDDTERARELASWGVDAITTHQIGELLELFGR